jgi:hypothetical protein
LIAARLCCLRQEISRHRRRPRPPEPLPSTADLPTGERSASDPRLRATERRKKSPFSAARTTAFLCLLRPPSSRICAVCGLSRKHSLSSRYGRGSSESIGPRSVHNNPRAHHSAPSCDCYLFGLMSSTPPPDGLGPVHDSADSFVLPPRPNPSADKGLVVPFPNDECDTSLPSPTRLDVFTLTPITALKLLCGGIEALVRLTGEYATFSCPGNPC